MKIFLDTTNENDVMRFSSIVQGVTTNPSSIAADGRPFSEIILALAAACPGPISAPVLAHDEDEMVAQAFKIRELGDNVYPKISMSPQGLNVVSTCAKKDIPTNVTLIFSLSQAILAAEAGASFISPFVGRRDDISGDGLDLIHQIHEVFEIQDHATEILAASIRTTQQVVQLAQIPRCVVTLPVSVLEKLFHHPLTDSGAKKFTEDYHQRFNTLSVPS